MNDRIPGTTWDNPVWHGKWRIYVADPESRHNYEFSHDDYDGAPDAGDSRHGFASSVEDAKRLIDEEHDMDIKAMDGCNAPPGVCKSKELGCVPGERDPSHDHCVYGHTPPLTENARAEIFAHFEGEGEGEIDPAINVDNVEMGAPRVRLKWYTPQGDKLLAHMARVSNTKATPDDPAERLIGYLLRNHHWSPFEMVNLCVEVHTERDISAQILRHWTLKFQEFSTRYAEVEDLRWSTECRFQDPKNRQSSLTIEEREANYDLDTSAGMSAANYDGDTVSYFDAVVNETRTRSLEAYQELLKRGVAKEVARRILPIGLMPTVMYINGNLRSWITYCMERTKPGVQKEHREIALAVEPVLASCFPLVWKAILLYREEQELSNWKVSQYDTIEDMFNNLCGCDWKERYPDSTISQAIAMNFVFKIEE